MNKEIRVRQPFSKVIDPLSVTTMSDYDMSLLLYRTWFNYDDGRIALPELIESWHFDSKSGYYSFNISKDAKWSNGKPVISSDLKANIDRAVATASSYGHGISELMEVGSFAALSESSFKIKTKTGKPADSFFQRMGSIFLAVAAPADFSKDLKSLKGNLLSNGPYSLTSANDEELLLEPNRFFKNLPSSSPKKILVRRPDPQFDLIRFLDGKTWENYIQTNTIIQPEALKKMLDSKLPYWTRGHDRVSLLKPLGSGEKLSARKEFIKSLSWEIQNADFKPTELNVVKANSLQPFGYPLFNKVQYSKPKNAFKKGTSFTILAPDNYYGEFHRKFIENCASKIGVEVIWKAVDVTLFFKIFKDTTEYDFLLISFGVADPEPATWMGLLFSKNNFISFTEKDLAEYKSIAGIKSKDTEISKFKALLSNISISGGFVPLFHFSTLSIGQKGLNFKNIRELDETVNFSKVILE